MKDIARRVWLVTIAALVLFVAYESVKTLLFPGLSVISSHVITVMVVTIMTFFVSRYAFRRYSAALVEINRQTVDSEDQFSRVSATLKSGQDVVFLVRQRGAGRQGGTIFLAGTLP